MKKFALQFSLICFSLVTFTGASDFLDKFEQLKDSNDDAKIRAFLTEAEKTEQENPDYYATAGNYWWNLAQSLSITTKPSEGDDLSVRDEESGEEVGSISTLGQANPEIPRKALTILSEGAKRFPKRADIALGLAHIQQKMRPPAEYVETLLKLLEVAKKDPKSLLWKKNEKLPTAVDQFLPEAIQGYSAALYHSESAESDALCAKLCDTTIEVFPDHPYAYNIKAALAATTGKQDEAIKYFELASSKAPDDPLILLNLADTYARAQQLTKAKKTYATILELKELSEELKKAARAGIKNLEQGDTGEAATHSESTPKSDDKTQSDSEEHSR